VNARRQRFPDTATHPFKNDETDERVQLDLDPFNPRSIDCEWSDKWITGDQTALRCRAQRQPTLDPIRA
jgi:hypothetical protein